MVNRNMLYSDYFEHWFETYRLPKIRQVTSDKYYVLHGIIAKSALGKTPLSKITRKDVQNFMNDYGKVRSKNTVLGTRMTIKASFADAQLDGLIKTNPGGKIELVTIEDGWDVAKQKQVREAKKWLEIDEYRRLKMFLLGLMHVNFQRSDSENYKLKNELSEEVAIFPSSEYPLQMRLCIIYIALKTGARYSEILGLTKEDIDFKNGLLNIDKTWDYKYDKTFVPTKNLSSIRKIPVDIEFLKVLEIYLAWLDKCEIEINQHAIFIKKGLQVFNSTINHALKLILICLKIEPITLHKLRHTHASILIAQGVPIDVVAKRLGHTDTDMIQRVYGHLLKDTEQKGNKKILELI
ncbi:tyrosine-type recombinase/integrase [Amphibacillus sp. Q70]|uniref:tyrosine-type recombinase/integrase n=1 Tax=Amphibacillus sp. Q70 TaxID=3453416 RepID=UPI003F85A896